MKFAFVIILILASLACGMAVPTPALNNESHIYTLPTATETVSHTMAKIPSVVGVVSVDVLTVRSCADKDAPSVRYYVAGDAIQIVSEPIPDECPAMMDAGYTLDDGCIRFANGDIWGQIAKDRFVAVVFRGRRFVETVCQ